MPLKEERLLETIKSESLFGYVQYDIEVPENLREAFANLPTIFKNIIVGRDDIGPFLKENAENEGLLTQFRRMLITSFSRKKEQLLHGYCSFVWTWGWFAKTLALCAVLSNEVLQEL